MSRARSPQPYTPLNWLQFVYFSEKKLMLKTHNEKARLELSAKGKSTKLNDVLKLYSTINYKESDGEKKK